MTVEQQILVLACYVSVALIRKIAKKREYQLSIEVTGARFVILHNPIEPPSPIMAPGNRQLSEELFIMGIQYIHIEYD